MLEIIKPELPYDVKSELIDYFRNTDSVKSQEFADIPDFMIGDIFNSYNTPYEEMKYELNDTQYWWYDMLQRLNSYLLKTVTQNKGGYSFIALKHAMKLLAKILEEEEKENGTDPMDGPNGPNPEQQKRMNDKIDAGMQKVMSDTSEEIRKVKDTEEMIGDGGNAAGKGPSELEELAQKAEILKDVMLNKRQVSRFIKKSIKGFKKGFGIKQIITEEDLFDSNSPEEILDEHYLFNEFLFADIAVRDTTSQMTAFDLYIDISGSMSSSLQLKDGASVRRIKMAMTLGLKMNQMKCLGKLYKFNTNIYPITPDDLWRLGPSGGTSIESVMHKIKRTGRPSVILTDGEDHFSTYCENAFIMSIINPRSYHLEEDLVKRMIKAKKYIIYKNGDLVIPKLKGEKVMA